MKQRVAMIVTCLNLVLCIAFLLICTSAARHVMDMNSIDELRAFCRLSARVPEAASYDREEMLRALRGAISGTELTGLIYAEDGTLSYASRPAFQDALAEAELSGIKSAKLTGEVRAVRDMDETWLFGYAPLPTGEVLSVARKAHPLTSALGSRFLWLILLAIAVAGISAAILQLSIRRTDRFVRQVQEVLQDFSDGQFDSRLQGVGDTIEQSASFNETLGRIRDRVFKQKTRNQALNTVINHMQSGILAVDEHLNIILVTPRAQHLLNIMGAAEGIQVDEASKDVNMSAVLTEAMHQDGVYTNEVAVRSHFGRGHTPIRLYVSPMMKDGVAVGAVALVEDITELRRLEQVRTDFAANVSHELKTPLTSIKGFVETLQNGAIDNPPMAHKFLRIIMLEADRLTRLINDILSITKLESGKDNLPSQRIRLDELVLDVCEMLEVQANEKGVTIHQPSVTEPSYVIGNPDRAEQMLINLIENAIKYNRNGGKVRVNMYNTKDNVNITVADTGIGIAEENLPRLFERFYRVDKGRSRSMGGTGLGLAIVKHIIRTMGGMIEVHSKVDEGSEFLITLPRAVDESPKHTELDDFE